VSFIAPILPSGCSPARLCAPLWSRLALASANDPASIYQSLMPPADASAKSTAPPASARWTPRRFPTETVYGLGANASTRAVAESTPSNADPHQSAHRPRRLDRNGAVVSNELAANADLLANEILARTADPGANQVSRRAAHSAGRLSKRVAASVGNVPT